MNITIEKVKEFLQNYERKDLCKPRLKKAAVLMLLYPKLERLHVLLTRRTEDVEHHKGQISFPGGSRDDEDNDLISTALRESEEEVGLPKGSVQVLGLFDDFETPSGFAITPVVGFAPSLPPLKHNADEVAEILEVPLAVFLDRGNERIERWERGGVVRDVFFYRFGDHEIWGATAAILRAFLRSVSSEGKDG